MAQQSRRFRVHHILCTNLYQGLGYSGAFCENMTRIVTQLRADPEQPLELVCAGDMICENCPNRIGDGCSQDANHVAVKDAALARLLDLHEGQTYTYRELCCIAAARLSREDFTASCQGCRWYTGGVCEYGALKESLEKNSSPISFSERIPYNEGKQ